MTDLASTARQDTHIWLNDFCSVTTNETKIVAYNVSDCKNKFTLTNGRNVFALVVY